VHFLPTFNPVDLFWCLLTRFACSATSLGMMNDEEKKTQRIEDIKELLS
jgi:hypothetical protein